MLKPTLYQIQVAVSAVKHPVVRAVLRYHLPEIKTWEDFQTWKKYGRKCVTRQHWSYVQLITRRFS